MNSIVKFILIVFIVVVVGLFIELAVKKSKSRMSFLVPNKLLVIKGKELGQKDPMIIYNTRNCTLEEAMEKVPKSKRNIYHEYQIHPHLSQKISEPFSRSYDEIKDGTAESSPVSFMYKTALGIVDIAHEITVPPSNDTIYRILAPNYMKVNAFQEGNNIYLK